MNVNDKILDAIDILIKAAIKEAKYDRTIQAKVEKLIDTSKGIYKCYYQGSTFNAYMNNKNEVLQQGDTVFILISQNDMSNQKTIIGKKY